VSRWLRTLRQSGIGALLIPTRSKRRAPTMAPDQVQFARQEIAAALKRRPEWQLRLRLVAIDLALAGKPYEDAAAAANVQPGALKHWMRRIRQRGIVEMLQCWERPARARELDADAMTLRELAKRETSPRVRKRFLALAEVADGKGLYDASVNSGLERNSIEKWIKRFQKEGVSALRKNEGRAFRLNAAQMSELRTSISKRPEMTGNELRELIWTRFRVRYSRSGAALLLTKNSPDVARPSH